MWNSGNSSNGTSCSFSYRSATWCGFLSTERIILRRYCSLTTELYTEQLCFSSNVRHFLLKLNLTPHSMSQFLVMSFIWPMCLVHTSVRKIVEIMLMIMKIKSFICSLVFFDLIKTYINVKPSEALFFIRFCYVFYYVFILNFVYTTRMQVLLLKFVVFISWKMHFNLLTSLHFDNDTIWCH